MEDILERHNLLNRPKKVCLIDGLPRPKYYWQKLRDSIRNTVDAVKRSDTEDKIVSHGIHFLRDICHDDALLCALYNKNSKVGIFLFSNHKLIDSLFFVQVHYLFQCLATFLYD